MFLIVHGISSPSACSKPFISPHVWSNIYLFVASNAVINHGAAATETLVPIYIFHVLRSPMIVLRAH